MDTDSSYKVLSGPLHDVVVPERRRHFFENYGAWFVEPYCAEHRNAFLHRSIYGDGRWVSMGRCCDLARKRDSRTPGKFKEEFRGALIYALNAKTYICSKDDADLDRDFPAPDEETDAAKARRLKARQEAAVKYSSKGLSKRTNRLTVENFASVLRDRSSVSGVNTGFIKKDNVVYTYSMRRAGLSYFYSKRKVMPDGVSTTYLDIGL